MLNVVHGKPLPMYGDGLQLREWLYIDHHARELLKVVSKVEIAESYNTGGHNEKTNLEVFETICSCLKSVHSVMAGYLSQ